MIDLWKDLLPNLLQGKQPLEFEDINKEYNPWVINQALTYNLDTILLAAEMNKSYNLDRKMQYDFYFNTIKKKKRPYNAWIKKQKENEDIDVIKHVYQLSNKKAGEILSILTESDLKDLRLKMNKGGK